MAYLIGVDIGTTGAKTALFNLKGETVRSAFEEYPLHTPHPLWSEQNPEDWWEATVKTLRRVVSGIDVGEVKGISFSGQMHGSVFLDKDNKVIRPCILWNDQRTDKQCKDAIDKLGQTTLNELTGNTVLSGFTLPKVLWLRENEPQNFERLRTVVLPKDYVRYRLAGEICMEVSDAAGTLMFDVKNRRWSEELMRRLDLDPGILPKCVESIDVAGEITREAAELTGLNRGTPVVAGGADNTCGAVGTGIIKNGRVLASTGTSGVIFCHTDEMKMDPKQRIHSFNHSVPNKWYLMGCMLSAGLSLRWFRDNLAQKEVEEAAKRNVDPYEIMTAEAGRVPVGSEGLIFLPYLMGERSPHGDANAKGVFFGLTPRHGKGHLIRAILEGVSFGMRDMLDIMRELGQDIREIRATGGGAKSPLWRQIQADILGAPILTVNAQEGPAFGAALLAGVGAGVYSNLEEAVEETVRVVGETEPIEENARIYDRYYEIYHSLYPILKPKFAEVNALARGKS
ncbi:MAG: xylulokinase [bacterium]